MADMVLIPKGTRFVWNDEIDKTPRVNIKFYSWGQMFTSISSNVHIGKLIYSGYRDLPVITGNGWVDVRYKSMFFPEDVEVENTDYNYMLANGTITPPQPPKIYPIGTKFVWNDTLTPYSNHSEEFSFALEPVYFYTGKKELVVTIVFKYMPSGFDRIKIDLDYVIPESVNINPAYRGDEGWYDNDYKTLTVAYEEWSIPEEYNDFMSANGTFTLPTPEPQSKFLYNGKAGTLYYNGKKEKGYLNGTQIQ